MKKRIIKFVSFLLCFCLLFQQSGFAQIVPQLDISGYVARMRSSFIQDRFRPLHLRYLAYDSIKNNFKLLLDKGDLHKPQSRELEKTTKDLLDYFLVGVSLPNDTFWVNLRPDSPDNVIDNSLAQTDVGKILLEADLQLKKETALATSPEAPEGKKYWELLYKKAGTLFGDSNVTIPTLTRPWIVPGEIIISETADNAYIYKATLKVMLEQDYLKGGRGHLNVPYNFDDPRLKALNEYSSQLIRELIIPKLTKEINNSRKYAPLRQVYYSLIMAQWFKQKYKGRSGLYSSIINTKNLRGLTSKTGWSKDTYFKDYQKSFKDGEYNVKEQVSSVYGQVIRSYFSGGIMLDAFGQSAGARGVSSPIIIKRDRGERVDSRFFNPGKDISVSVIGGNRDHLGAGDADLGAMPQPSEASSPASQEKLEAAGQVLGPTSGASSPVGPGSLLERLRAFPNPVSNASVLSSAQIAQEFLAAANSFLSYEQKGKIKLTQAPVDINEASRSKRRILAFDVKFSKAGSLDQRLYGRQAPGQSVIKFLKFNDYSQALLTWIIEWRITEAIKMILASERNEARKRQLGTMLKGVVCNDPQGYLELLGHSYAVDKLNKDWEAGNIRDVVKTIEHFFLIKKIGLFTFSRKIDPESSASLASVLGRLSLHYDTKAAMELSQEEYQNADALLAQIPAEDRARKIAQWFQSLAETVALMHRIGIVHRDLKPQNIFVNVDGTVSVIDWEGAVFRPNGSEQMLQGVFSSRFASPRFSHFYAMDDAYYRMQSNELETWDWLLAQDEFYLEVVRQLLEENGDVFSPEIYKVMLSPAVAPYVIREKAQLRYVRALIRLGHFLEKNPSASNFTQEGSLVAEELEGLGVELTVAKDSVNTAQARVDEINTKLRAARQALQDKQETVATLRGRVENAETVYWDAVRTNHAHDASRLKATRKYGDTTVDDLTQSPRYADSSRLEITNSAVVQAQSDYDQENGQLKRHAQDVDSLQRVYNERERLRKDAQRVQEQLQWKVDELSYYAQTIKILADKNISFGSSLVALRNSNEASSPVSYTT
ncbi:MAG: phosphotransferase, partial [Candidatus Omnitrophota bacterium]